MKRIFYLILILMPFLLPAKPVMSDQIQQKAEELIRLKSPQSRISSIVKLDENIAYLIQLEPLGFILLASDTNINPVIGYSFQNQFVNQTQELVIMQGWLKNIYESNLNYLTSEQKQSNQILWQNILAEMDDFEQWPEAGTTSTGGWLETNWAQGYPYNQFCPIDPENGGRCVAGCPSIVMAQILNFHREINLIQLTDEDDYHMFSSGANNYIIDDGSHTHDFLSWQGLNDYFTQIESVYSGNDDLSDEQVAALIFACGAVIKQSFASNISGNYYDQQIIKGFRRFGFSSSELLWEDEPLVFTRLAENMKAALPARLGILAPSAGHQIVVDGYNTDKEYHFNFGWGGSSNGWYSFPLTGMPYQLNIFGSVDLDINQTWEDCPDFEIASPLPGSVFNEEAWVPVQIVETGTVTIDSVSVFIDNMLYQTDYFPTSCNIMMNLFGNGNHKLTVVAFEADKKLRVKNVDFKITRGNIVFTENFDDEWQNNWELESGNIDHTWQIRDNSLESFSETNSTSTSSATCPLAYENLSETITSPTIFLPVVDELEWNFYVGFCDKYPSYPGITASISNDGGSSWTQVWQTTSTIEEWTWKFVSIDLCEFAGQEVKIKYHCSGFSYADISLDDVHIIEPQNVSVGNELIASTVILSNYPNPFNPTTTIYYSITTEDAQTTKLEIYNLRGQKVRDLDGRNSIVTSSLDCGNCFADESKKLTHSIIWNGRDNSNRFVSSGVYFVKLKGVNLQSSRKMLLLK